MRSQGATLPDTRGRGPIVAPQIVSMNVFSVIASGLPIVGVLSLVIPIPQ